MMGVMQTIAARSRRLLPATAAIAIAITLAGCSGSTPSATSSADDLESVSGTPTASPSTETVSVPLQSTTDSGAPRLEVEISVGGGAPFTVVLDTGSTGLFVSKSAVGSATTATGQSYTEDYVSSKLTSELATATVSIGGASTSSPMTLGLIESDDMGGIFGNAQGIMGVAPAEGAAAQAGLLSPFVQLAAPYDQGFTVDLTGGSTGTLTLGAPSPASGTISTPLTPLPSAPAAMPDAKLWAKDVDLCWTIATLAQACGPTDLDTGAPSLLLNSAVVTGVPAGSNGVLDAGQSIAIATPAGASLWSLQTGTTAGVDLATLDALGSETSYNTGIAFFTNHVVAFDWATGQLLVTAT